MRHNEWDRPPRPPHPAESNQDHKLAGRVATISVHWAAGTNRVFPKPAVAQVLSAQMPEGMPRSDRRAAAHGFRLGEAPIPLSDNVFRSRRDAGRLEARPAGRFAERPPPHARGRKRARRRGATATSSCARQVNWHNAIREAQE